MVRLEGAPVLQRIAEELLSGVTVAIVSLPLPMGFGIVATGTSEGALAGIYGAIFAASTAIRFAVRWDFVSAALPTRTLSRIGDRHAHSPSPVSGIDDVPESR